MKRSAIILAMASVLLATPALSSPYISLIDATARRHGIDPVVLRAITEQETNKHPWSFNADGEGFKFASKEETVQVLWSISKAPWMVKSVSQAGKVNRRFFTNSSSATSYVNQLARTGGLTRRTDDSKALSRGEVRVRQLNLVNTDLGIAQINYRWHGKGKGTVQKWLDPAFNLNYAASHLAELKAKHGSDLAAAGYYHSGNAGPRSTYMKTFMPRYLKEKRDAGLALVSSN